MRQQPHYKVDKKMVLNNYTRVIVLSILVLCCPFSSNADTVYLKNGRIIKASSVWENKVLGVIKCKVGEAVLKYPVEKVLRIERDEKDDEDNKNLSYREKTTKLSLMKNKMLVLRSELKDIYSPGQRKSKLAQMNHLQKKMDKLEESIKSYYTDYGSDYGSDYDSGSNTNTDTDSGYSTDSKSKPRKIYRTIRRNR